MMRTKNLIPAALVMLPAIGASTAPADYDFEGDATGQCGTIHPWANWEGTLYTDATPEFDGTWSHDNVSGTMTGDATYDSQTRCYYVEEGTWDTNEYTLSGEWWGYFCPQADTAYGEWWATGGVDCDGTFWGNLAD